MNLNKVQDKIIEEFESIIDGMKSKFNYFRHLAHFGKKDTAAYSIKKTDENLVKATKSKIWLEAKYVDGKIYYAGDSDNQIVKGIVHLFVNVFSGRTAREIINANVYFLNEIKLYSQLSAERIKELSAVLQQIRVSAVNLKIKNKELEFA
ncbi:SufE family protein [Terrimonas rubra]|uniref:SufE family protein n=1 Tax=Terrimonas rubra TaxID=1035890 RepID=A0ABW6ACD0_9BACT